MSDLFAPQNGLPQYSQKDLECGVAGVLGSYRISLCFGYYVDITANQAMRISNPETGFSFSISSDHRLALIHPLGRVIQDGKTIEVEVYDKECIKNAKLFRKGITFTNDKSALVYKIDSHGIRTTSETFYDQSLTDSVFTMFSASSAVIDHEDYSSLLSDLSSFVYHESDTDFRMDIGKVTIYQTKSGETVIGKKTDNFQLVLSIAHANKITIKTSNLELEINASLTENFLKITTGNKILYCSGSDGTLTARVGRKQGGFNRTGSISLFSTKPNA